MSSSDESPDRRPLPWGRSLPLLAAATALAGLMALGIGWAALSAGPPSPAAAARFSADFLQTAAQYRQGAYLMLAGSRILTLILLSWLVFSRAGRDFLRQLLPWSVKRPFLAAALAGVVISGILTLVRLPLSFYRGYVWEHRFGLSTQTAAAWFGDLLLAWAINALILALSMAVLSFLIARRPQNWWLPAGLLLGLGLVLLTALSPLVIDPLFHDFTVLEDEAMLTSLTQMASRAGVSVDEVLVMDASRRTLRVNAYFTGVAGTRRIVLYDTLLERHPPAEVELVTAHELGHWAEQHVHKGLLLGSLGVMGGLFLLARLLRSLRAEGWWHGPGDPYLVAVVLLAVTATSLLTAPVQNAISRKWERDADRISYEISGQAPAAVELSRRMAIHNLADVDPHPWIRFTLSTHPSPLERLRAAEAFSDR